MPNQSQVLETNLMNHAKSMKSALKSALLAMLLLPAGYAFGQGISSHALTPADKAAVRQYVITDAVFDKVRAVSKDAQAKGVALNPFKPGAHSLDESAAALDAQPAAHGILSSHGLTAHEYVLASAATLGAVMTVKYGSAKSKTSGDDLVNPANIAFVQKHMAELGVNDN
jgi:hypothetical protein